MNNIMLQLGDTQIQPALPNGYMWRTFDGYTTNVVTFLEKMYGCHITVPVRTTCVLAICTNDDILVGVITGLVQKLVIGRTTDNVMQVQHLAVRKKMQGKKIASLLLRELARRHAEVKSAIYPGCKTLSMFTAVEYRRGINITKLLATKNMTVTADVESVVDQHILPNETSLMMVPMLDEHVTAAWNLLTNYLDKFVVHPVWTEQEFRLLFQNSRVKSFVVIDNKEVVDFASYFVTETDIITANVFYTTGCKYSSYRVLSDLVILVAKNGADLMIMTNLFEGELLPLFHQAESVVYGGYGVLTHSLKPNAVGLVV